MHEPARPSPELAIERFGDGDRAVVLAHGGGQTRHAWRSTGLALAASGWNAFTFDLRGHGESPRAPGGAYSAETFIEDFITVRALVPSPPVLVGASLGGAVALLAIAGGHVDARALVLVDVGARLMPAGVERIIGFMRARPDGFASLDDAADAIAAYSGRARSTNLGGLEKNLARGDDGRWRWRWDPALLTGFDPASTFDEGRLSAALARLTVPLLVIRGGRSDVLDADAAAETARLGGGEFVDISGAGHMVAGDANDAFTAALLTFLNRFPAAAAR